MRIAIVVLPIVILAGPVQAGSVEVAGKLGYLSEWEVTARVTERVTAGKREFSGPLTVRHIGVCTPGRPVEMAGEIRYREIGWMTPRMRGTLVIDGAECGFEAKLAGTYDGVMSCQQWNGVPLSLSIKPGE
jgi:hypothetical protein